MNFLNLGELESRLSLYDEDEVLNVALSSEWGSYRGYYDQMYIGYVPGSHGHSKVGHLRDIIEAALSKGVMEGYKGGEYPVNEMTEVCFARGDRYTEGLYIEKVTKGFEGVIEIKVSEED